jgi:hypothetical protein
MSDLDNMPDFDNMSPEELQLWMESLAKRQGASEGLITSADMDVPEIDPDSVTIDEPGYVPSESFTSSSMKSKPSAAAKVEADAEAEEATEPEPAKTTKPETAPPVTATPGRGTGERVRLPTQPPPVQAPPSTPQIEQPAANISAAEEFVAPAASLTPLAAESQPEPAGVSGSALAWLESLAANQGEGDFELDLSSLSGETFQEDEVAAEREAVNPESWLESLVSSGGELDEVIEADRPSARVSGAFIETTPRWMDSSSRDEDDDIELPDLAAIEADDPQAWLSSLSASEGYDEEGVGVLRSSDTLDKLDESEDERAETPAVETSSEMTGGFSGLEVDQETLDEIKKAIAEGRVSSEQMQLLLDYQTNIMASDSSTAIELDDFYDPDAPPEKGEIPDWLLASAGAPPDLDAPTIEQSTPALIDALENASAAPGEMPDWLKDDLIVDQPVDFQSIFAEDDEESDYVLTTQEGEDELDMESALEFEIDESDSWGEAFELERNQGLGSVDNPPEWYERNLSDPDRIAAVEEIERTRLTQSMLPAEQQLQPAEQVDVPEWLQDVAAQQGEISTDMPEWLREAEQATASDAIVSEEIPDWLVEVVGGYEEPAQTPVQTPAPAPEPAFVITQPPPKRETPPPPPRPAVEVPADVAAALQQARELAQGEDVADGLTVYESLIRANVALEDVVNDLQSLKRQHRTNPAVYRVLGDGLMRQGNLQAALDTYRDALNHL